MDSIETTLNGFLQQYLSMLTADLQDDQWDLVPIDGLHTVRWVLAHLASTGDYGLRLLGQTTKCPRTWHIAYGPGSSGLTHPEIKPSKVELMNKLSEVYQALAGSHVAASPELLSQLHLPGFLENFHPNQRTVDIPSLTTHFSIWATAMCRQWACLVSSEMESILQ